MLSHIRCRCRRLHRVRDPCGTAERQMLPIVGVGIVADQRIEPDRAADDEVVAAVALERVVARTADQPVVAQAVVGRRIAGTVADERVVVLRTDGAFDLEPGRERRGLVDGDQRIGLRCEIDRDARRRQPRSR